MTYGHDGRIQTAETQYSLIQTKREDISSGKEKISILLLEELGYFDVPIQVSCLGALCLQFFDLHTKSLLDLMSLWHPKRVPLLQKCFYDAALCIAISACLSSRLLQRV